MSHYPPGWLPRKASTADFTGRFLHELYCAVRWDWPSEPHSPRTPRREGFVYAMVRSYSAKCIRESDHQIKFGISISPLLRRNQLRQDPMNGHVEILETVYVQNMHRVESVIHRHLRSWRLPSEREWFHVAIPAAATLMAYIRRFSCDYSSLLADGNELDVEDVTDLEDRARKHYRSTEARAS